MAKIENQKTPKAKDLLDLFKDTEKPRQPRRRSVPKPTTPTLPKVIAHTDGAVTRHGGGVGGWGAVIECGGKHKTIGGYILEATVSVVELTAVIESLKSVKRTKHPMLIRTDSQYVCSCAKNGERWRKYGWINSSGNPVANKELVADLLEQLKRHRRVRKVHVSWVKGHSGNRMNEVADFIATSQKKIGFIVSQSIRLPKGEDFDPSKLVKKLG